ncbi:alpha/beta hydrolase [Acidobacteria bacterium AH-259-D05]|nr:alpha/beta hydrolase [Acidobacteria bacterium AH-259-D05]
MVRDDWIEVEGVQIHYLSGGGSKCPLVLLHGGSADSASLSWRPSIEAFSRAYRVIAPDLPGFGKSHKPRVEYDLEYYTRFLNHFTQQLGLTQFYLVGLSLGGHISVSFTLQFPSRVKKLVLVDSAGIGTELRWRILGRLLVKVPGLQKRVRKAAARSRETIKLSLRTFVHNKEIITDELVDEVSEAIAVPGSGRAWRSYLQNEMDYSGFRHDFLNRLAEITIPTLIVHGSNDKLISVKWAKKAHALISNSELFILQECGHWPPREKRAEFNHRVLEFLAT